MRKTIVLVFSLFFLSTGFSQHRAAKAGKMLVIEHDYTGDVIDGYTLYLPKSYDASKSAYPIILYLCGGSSVGGEIDVVKRWPIPKLLVEETDMSLERNQYALDSFIVVSPHMKEGKFRDRQWYQNAQAMKEILAEVLDKYRADSKRIYLTGLSRGGHGSWGLMSNMGNTFAAAVPIAGDLHGIESYDQMKDLPIWVAHNTGDNMVGHSSSVKAVEKIEALTGKKFLKLTTPTAAGSNYLKHDRIFNSVPLDVHDSWTAIYESVEFYKWLLKYRRP